MADVTYPKQIASAKRKDKVFGIDYFLDTPTEDMPPMEVHAGWSRYKLTIIDKTKKFGTITPVANIPAVDIPVIFKRTEAIIDREINCEINSKTLEFAKEYKNDPAFKAYNHLTFIINKSLTLPEYLDKYGETNFVKQINYLKTDAEKQSAKECLADFHNGKLNKVIDNRGRCYVYKKDCKELKSVKDAKGNTLHYNISIFYSETLEYKFQVRIENWYGNGLNKTYAEFALSSEEWYGIIYRLNNTLNAFEICNFKALEKREKILANAYKNK